MLGPCFINLLLHAAYAFPRDGIQSTYLHSLHSLHTSGMVRRIYSWISGFMQLEWGWVVLSQFMYLWSDATVIDRGQRGIGARSNRLLKATETWRAVSQNQK